MGKFTFLFFNIVIFLPILTVLAMRFRKLLSKNLFFAFSVIILAEKEEKKKPFWPL